MRVLEQAGRVCALPRVPLHVRPSPSCAPPSQAPATSARLAFLSNPVGWGASQQSKGAAKTRGIVLMAASDALRWQEVATAEEQRPMLPRSGHSAAALPAGHSHDVIIFGGYTEGQGNKREATNEAWLLSLANEKWTPVKYTSQRIPRVRLAGQAVVVGSKLWVRGGGHPGFNKDGGDILSDVWTLDLDTYRWDEVKLQGEALQPISRFQAVAVGDRIFIHTHRSTADILVLDTVTSKLSRQPIRTPAGSPPSRGLHSVTEVAGALYLFGGAPQKGPMLGDLWRLQLDRLEWEPLRPAGEPPHARCSHAAVAVGHRIYFFAGSYYRENAPGLEGLNDVFVLDTKEMAWQRPQNTGSAPLPRNAHTMVGVDSHLVIHGGWKAFVETYNDTFVLKTAV